MWITGQVVDELGRALAGVTIEASSGTSPNRRRVSSRTDGHYVIDGLRPGSYTLRFARQGFRTVERETRTSWSFVATINAQLYGDEPAGTV